MSASITEIIDRLENTQITGDEQRQAYEKDMKSLKKQLADMKGLTVGDDAANMHANILKAGKASLEKFEKNLKIAEFL